MPEQTSRPSPGPWTVAKATQHWWEDAQIEAGGYTIAAVYTNHGGGDSMADAHLIAAAPDLLDAAEAAEQFLMSKARRDPQEIEVVRGLADAAATARGEAQP